MSHKSTLKAIAKASKLSDLEKHLKMGFELEYQSSDSGDGEIDWDAVTAAVSDWINDADNADIARLINNDNAFAIWKVGVSDIGLLSAKGEQKFYDIEEKLRDEVQEHHISLDDYIENSVDLAPSTERVDDSSVRGGEIITVGGHTAREVLFKTNYVLENNGLNIDSACSYHLHLSAKDVTHSYGEQFQAEMIAYLLNTTAKNRPGWLTERLTYADGARKWAKFQISKDKYTAVNFHDTKRWEFRLWGNVSDIKSARYAVVKTMRAYQHAVRVKLGKAQALVDCDVRDFAYICQLALKDKKTFSETQAHNLCDIGIILNNERDAA